jgi:hypothetical protein
MNTEIKKEILRLIGNRDPSQNAADAISKSIDLQINLDCNYPTSEGIYGEKTLGEVAEQIADHTLLKAHGDIDGTDFVFFRGAMTVVGRGKTRDRAKIHAQALAASHGFHGDLY